MSTYQRLENIIIDWVCDGHKTAGSLTRRLLETFSEQIDNLYEEVKHGDEAHQKWLKDKFEEFKKKYHG